MSGETSVAFEESISLSLASEESADFSAETEDEVQKDPVASFLKNHGKELTTNHKGELMTYYQAVEKCPALPMMIMALGEGALSLTAAQNSEDSKEDEVRETEIEQQQPENEPDLIEETDGEINSQDKEELVTSKNGVAVPKKVNDRTTVEKEQETAQLTSLHTGGAGTIINTKPAEVSSSANTPLGRGVVDSSPEPGTKSKTKSANLTSTTTEHRNADTSTKNKSVAAKSAISAKKEQPKNHKKKSTTPQKSHFQGGTLEKGDSVRQRTVEVPKGSAKNEILPESTFTRTGNISETLPDDNHDYTANKKNPNRVSNTLNRTPEDLITHDIEAPGDNEASGQVLFEEHESSFIEQQAGESKVIEGLPAPIKQIEQTIRNLAEQNEEDKKVPEILDEITIKVKEARAETRDLSKDPKNATELLTPDKKVEEELKELFIKLFDYTETEYNPELLDSFVKLALEIDISELILETEQENAEEIQSAQDRGTHEILKQLLVAITTLKKKALHTYQVGKSVLYLCFLPMPALEPVSLQLKI
jgi:hypothetical protein